MVFYGFVLVDRVMCCFKPYDDRPFLGGIMFYLFWGCGKSELRVLGGKDACGVLIRFGFADFLMWAYVGLTKVPFGDFVFYFLGLLKQIQVSVSFRMLLEAFCCLYFWLLDGSGRFIARVLQIALELFRRYL